VRNGRRHPARPLRLLSTASFLADNRSGWHRAGRGPQRGCRAGDPARWGCSVTGPGRLCRF